MALEDKVNEILGLEPVKLRMKRNRFKAVSQRKEKIKIILI